MQYLKIKFVDFWPDFDPFHNFITDVLSPYYELVYDDRPDYLFFSCFGVSHLSYNCVKVLFIGENLVPDFNICDYAIGFDYMNFGDRYLRLPLYVTTPGFGNLEKEKVIDDGFVLNRKFCSIVVSNAANADYMRERFFTLLSEYKAVDSGGVAWNNIGGPVADKLAFLSNYKFNIAFENSSVRGYTTEKITDSMCAYSIPVYWGNPWVDREFNENSFVNSHRYGSIEELVEYVIHLDSSDEDYLAMMHQPWLTENSYSDWEERLLSFVKAIVEKPLGEAKYMPGYGQSAYVLKQMKQMNRGDAIFRFVDILNKYDKIKSYCMNRHRSIK